MDSGEFYAKSRPQETLAEHTRKVIEAASTIFDLFGDRFSEKEKRLVRLACEYHDRGKVDKIFQEMVCGKRRTVEVPHGFLSGLFLQDDAKADPSLFEGLSEEEITALFTAVHYHHVRPDNMLPEEFKKYAEENLHDGYERLTGRPYKGSFRYLNKLLFRNREGMGVRESLSTEEQRDAAYGAYVVTVGLLNRADYAASGGYPVEIAGPTGPESLSSRVERRFPTLRPAQEFLRGCRGGNAIVIAPTGSGKTEGALLWAGAQKLFYTLPMKVSANGIYRRIHDAPADGGAYGFSEYTALLHSDAATEYHKIDASEDGESAEATFRRQSRQYTTAKRFAYPVTVSTVDQLFKFVFKALGTELNAATLKYSCVVIDEMQAYEPRLLAMLVGGLKFVASLGGRYAVVTATLPKFIMRSLGTDGVDFQYREFASELRRHVVRLMPDEFVKGSFDVELIREQGASKKVLVVCNTVGNAQKLKDLIPEARLLHSRFVKRDRDRLEQEIVRFQAAPDSCGIWIATQLVEASLDIDFDFLHTELCSVDSLLQRMGRCWRSRSYDAPEPNVYVYDHGPCGVYDKTVFERTKRFLTPYLGRIFTEPEKLEFVDKVYDDSDDEFKKSEYYTTFRKSLTAVKEIVPTSYTKAEADDRFRDIYSMTVMPDSVYRENREEIDALLDVLRREATASKEDVFNARQKLKEFTLQIDMFGNDRKFADKATFPGTEIHLTRARYSAPEFGDLSAESADPESGLGLLREEEEGSAFL